MALPKTMESALITDYIRKMVEEQCKKETNFFGYEIWTYHISVVVKYAKILAEKLGADPEIVELSALLHDYASISNKNLVEDHHIHGAVLAEKVLSRLGYPKARINRIKYCIKNHRGSVQSERLTLEAECIASADAMAHIDQIFSLFHLAYVKHRMSVDEGITWVEGKIDRSWNKLCPEAKEIIKHKYVSAKTIMNSK